MIQGADGALRSGAFAKVVGRVGSFLAHHPQPLLARAYVQLLIRAPGWDLEVRDLSGYVHRIDTRDQMGANLLVGRYRLPARVMAHIRQGDWVIDVGANIGVITSQLCAAAGGTGPVWAFEPVPANLGRLRSLKERNGLSQLQIFPFAVGAEAGAAEMGMPPPGRSGWGSITKSWDVAERLPVQVRPLDALVSDGAPDGQQVRFVKIDVEGFEPEVLQGAASMLTEHRPLVFCEFNDILLRDRGRSSADLLALFADLGYRPAEDDAVMTDRLADRVVNLLLAASTPG